MKNIYLITTAISAVFFFAACSGEGGSKFESGANSIAVTNCETYTTVQENDLLVKDDAATTIKVVHDINGTKTVCVLSGSAHIIREVN
ncbi:MAG: hypothetical protein PHU40_08430 [Sulfurimonas sp.]|nr:hypothetical protein [Sulfurimonas sp.]